MFDVLKGFVLTSKPYTQPKSRFLLRNCLMNSVDATAAEVAMGSYSSSQRLLLPLARVGEKLEDWLNKFYEKMGN